LLTPRKALQTPGISSPQKGIHQSEQELQSLEELTEPFWAIAGTIAELEDDAMRRICLKKISEPMEYSEI
jgi:hypothetical protein